ncbi:MAG: transposase [Bacteroidetes bacterium SW_11_45_7]|nr:MAG: transposase [Bacteroidetes bacterium SW_11_45_7]
MSTFTQILYQIVFSTKHRERTLSEDGRPQLFKYIQGVLKKQNCHPYCINGVADHLHIATHIHPSVALADLVKDIKLSSRDHIKNTHLFKDFIGWQDGYAAFTYRYQDKDQLINYIKRQEEHHQEHSFREELKSLLNEHGVAFKEEYLL